MVLLLFSKTINNEVSKTGFQSILKFKIYNEKENKVKIVKFVFEFLSYRLSKIKNCDNKPILMI